MNTKQHQTADVLAGELRVTNTAYSPGITTAIAAAVATLPAGTYWLISDDARDAVVELIDAAAYALRTRDDAGALSDTAEHNIRAALAAFGGAK